KVNRQWERVLGYSKEELEARKFLEFVHPDDMQPTLDAMAQLGKDEKVLNFINRYLAKDGSYRFIEWRSYPHDDLIYAAARDITEHKQIEMELQESDALLKKLSQQVPGVIYQYQVYPDGKACFPFASEHIKDIYGITAESAKKDASLVIERLHPEDKDRIIANIAHSKETLEKWEDEYRVVLPEKGERWVRGVANPEKLDDGSVLWHGYIYDITETKKEQLEIKRLKEQFELAVAGTNDGIWDWDLKTNELFLSKRWKAILGYEDNELDNHLNTFMKLLYKEDAEEVNTYIQCYLAGKIPYYFKEFRMVHKDGSLRWILAKGEVLRDENGIPYRMAGSHSDITERKEMEAELKESQIRLELAMDAGEHGFWDWNLITNNTYFSPTYFTMLGYKNNELPMNLETFMQLIHPKDAENVMPIIQTAIESGQPYEVEFRLKCKDGSYKWIMGKGKTYLDEENGKPNRAVGVHIDIHDRKIAEEKLRESEEKSRTILETTADGFFTLDLNGNILSSNQAFQDMLGYSKEEILNLNINQIDYLETPEITKQRIENIKQNGSDQFETKHLKKNGEIIDVEVSVTVVKLAKPVL
ncbi:MAG TPA: PAS domain-containing protein, partial [Alphaproteobacteria bacterium]|nr:PAS domain-containing protein [Alphaproteobacteria bacterium]